MNVASTRFHLPMGLYDCDLISGAISVDVGREGEEYQGISKSVIHAEGKLVLRDEIGIFGNPTADSLRTCINEKTKHILALFFTPPEVEESYVWDTLKYLQNLYSTECPKAIISFDVLSSSG